MVCLTAEDAHCTPRCTACSGRVVRRGESSAGGAGALQEQARLGFRATSNNLPGPRDAACPLCVKARVRCTAGASRQPILVNASPILSQGFSLAALRSQLSSKSSCPPPPENFVDPARAALRCDPPGPKLFASSNQQVRNTGRQRCSGGAGGEGGHFGVTAGGGRGALVGELRIGRVLQGVVCGELRQWVWS